MARVVRLSVLVVLLVLLLATAVLAAALGTEAGTRYLLQRGMALVPGELSAQEIRGSLLGGTHLEGLQYKSEAVSGELGELEVTLSLPALLRGNLRLPRVQARELLLELPEPAAPVDDEPFTLPELPDVHIPLSISLPDTRMEQIRIRRPETPDLELDLLSLSAGAGGQRVQVRELVVQHGDDRLRLQGQLAMAAPWWADLHLDWDLELPEAARRWAMAEDSRGRGRGRVTGTPAQLSVQHELLSPLAIHSEGKLLDLNDAPHGDLHHRWERLALRLPDDEPLTLRTGQLRTAGDPEHWQLEIATSADGAARWPALELRARAEADPDTITLHESHLETDQHGRLELSGVLLRDALRWQGELQARDIQPALLEGFHDFSPQQRQHLERLEALTLSATLHGDDASLVVERARLQAAPGLMALQGRLRWQPELHWQAQVESPALDAGPWLRELLPEESSDPGSLRLSLDAYGDQQTLNLRHSRLHTDHGVLAVRGRADWSQYLRWDLEAQGRELNPALLRPEVAGAIALEAGFRGGLPPDAPPALEVRLQELGGSLRGHPVEGAGHMRLNGLRQLETDLRLAIADTRFQAQGQWSAEPDLRLRLDAPRLGRLWPELEGTAEADLHVSGTREAPLLDGHARARELRVNDLRLARLDMELQAREIPDPRMRVRIALEELEQAQRALLDRGRLRGEGTLRDHVLSLELQHLEEQLTTDITGGLAEPRQWSGTIAELTLSGPTSGHWKLREAVALNAAADNISLETFCLLENTDAGRLCGEGHWRGADDMAFAAELAEVPLAPMAMFLTRPVHLEGRLTARARMEQRDGSRSGHLEINAGSGHVLMSALDEDSPEFRIPWEQLEAGAELRDQSLESELTLVLDEHSEAHARLHTLLRDDPALDGHLDLRLDDLRWVELFAPQVREARGSVQGRLTLDGTLASPRFGGEITLEDGAMAVPEIGIALRDIHFSARGAPEGLLLMNGAMRSGDGDLLVNGELDAGAAFPWPLYLQVTGSDFEAVHRPDARATLNPDLQIVTQGTEVDISGSVLVPAGRLHPRELPHGASRVSPDARLVTLDEPDDAVVSPWTVNTDVQVRLGDDVGVEGFGFTSGLEGEVRIRHQSQRPPHLTGEIRMVEGRFRAWGQNLAVDRGRLLFEGPADNPGLDIRAIRTIPAHRVRVGLELGGTLRNPRSRVFSDPPMEESEAMSFLLTGRPLSGTTEDEAAIILQAVTRYGIERGEFIFDRLGQPLGVDVAVDTEAEFEETSLMLGRRISSRLYLRYSVGLFEAVNTVMLQYQMTPRVTLETRSSSEKQSVDMIYRRER